LLPDLHTGFSRGRSGGLVFLSLEEFFRDGVAMGAAFPEASAAIKHYLQIP